MRQSYAFTLVELLVVIAIIAIVAAMLFPVFAMAKGSAKKTSALSNLSQIGKATHLYLADYDDHLPVHFPSVPVWPGYDAILFMSGNGFDKQLGRYLGSPAVWYSDADRLPVKDYTSFTFNEQLAFGWSMSSIPRPSEAIYATDRTDIYTATPHGPVDTYVWWQFTNAMPFTEASLPGVIDPVAVASQIDPIRYVGDTGLYLFLDGHAASMPFDRTWGDATHNLHLATKP